MRTYTKTFNEVTVKAYNDSNVEWVVWSDDSPCTEQRFDKSVFTMTHAMEFFSNTVLAFRAVND